MSQPLCGTLGFFQLPIKGILKLPSRVTGTVVQFLVLHEERGTEKGGVLKGSSVLVGLLCD